MLCIDENDPMHIFLKFNQHISPFFYVNDKSDKLCVYNIFGIHLVPFYLNFYFNLLRFLNLVRVQESHATMAIIQFMKQQKMQAPKQWKFFSRFVSKIRLFFFSSN